jgi:hypothetical protein
VFMTFPTDERFAHLIEKKRLGWRRVVAPR